jgi:glycosyltransferase involved in cell wall biosynthesis
MAPTPTVLHVLSQRPSLTGSGVTLEAIVSEAHRAGWDQHVVVGTPANEPRPGVGPLDPARVHPLIFDRAPLDFPVPGMSDVMPYRSTVFSSMDAGQISHYRSEWKRHLGSTIDAVRPNLIHSHHLWIVSSLLKEIAPTTPVVTHCHATGMRQMDLCPHLAVDVRKGCSRNDRFLVLREGHADILKEQLQVSDERIDIVGAGYRHDLFHTRDRAPHSGRIVYAGKYSAAKGLPCLLDAFEKARASRPDSALHVAGSGSGTESEAIERRLKGMEGVVVHGMLDQRGLSDLLRTAELFVLPSFYEGVPLVLIEAAACGCHVVATELPGIVEVIAPALGSALKTIPLPHLRSVDQPDPANLPPFVDRLAAVLEGSMSDSTPPTPEQVTQIEDRFSWSAVFRRIQRQWQLALDDAGQDHPR